MYIDVDDPNDDDYVSDQDEYSRSSDDNSDMETDDLEQDESNAEVDELFNIIESNDASFNQFRALCPETIQILATQSLRFESTQLNFDESDEYDLSKGEIIEILNLEIGSNMIPRFNCCAHKINIVVRRAVKLTSHFANSLSELSNFIKNIRKSIEQSAAHRAKKCKPKRQNFTRWNSSFNMLICILKSNIFNHDYICPISKNEIQEYLQILAPLYLFTNDLQSDKANISSVVPAILVIIHANLERMVLQDQNQNEFRNNLVAFIKHKFSYELNSKVYLVAAILNVSSVRE